MKDVLTKSDIDNYSLPSTLNQRKLTDGKGLYVLVTPAGKYWRYNYRFNGEYKTLALGIYPDVSIDQARVKHQIARNQVKRGIDPSVIRAGKKRTGKQLEVAQLKLNKHHGQRSVKVDEANYLFELERLGVCFYSNQPQVPDTNGFVMTAMDLITFQEDPVLFLATKHGVSRDVYLAWMAADHDVQCSAYTKQGRRCKHIIKHKVDAKTFEQLLTARCVQH